MSVPPLITPEQQQATDSDHVRLLGIFHFVGAGFAVLGMGFLGLHFFVFRAIFTQPTNHGFNQAPFPPFLLIGIVYLLFALWLIVSLLLNLFAGFSLLNRKNRSFCMVVAALNCVHVPFGTVLGVFTLIVLSRPSVRDSFG